MISRRPLIVLTGLVVWLLGLSAFAIVAAPANDNFASAQVLSLPYSGSTSLMDTATVESGEPLHSCRKFGAAVGTNTVWFTFNLPENGVVQLSTDGSNFTPGKNSLLSIYTGGSLATLTEVGCQDDISDQNHYSDLDIFLPAGTYFLKISNWSLDNPLVAGSTLQLSVNFTPGITPSATPTETAIPTATHTPTNTAISTATATLPPSFTPTSTLPAAIELIINGDFEIDADGNKTPDQWAAQGLSKDKRVCNKPDKIVAYTGNCAFQFKGLPGEKSELRQISIVVGVPANSLLTLTIAADTSINLPLKLVIVKLQYQEPDAGQNQNGKDKLKLKLNVPTTDYNLFSTVLIADGTLTNVLVRLPFNETAGKIRLDALSLSATLP